MPELCNVIYHIALGLDQLLKAKIKFIVLHVMTKYNSVVPSTSTNVCHKSKDTQLRK